MPVLSHRTRKFSLIEQDKMCHKNYFFSTETDTRSLDTSCDIYSCTSAFKEISIHIFQTLLVRNSYVEDILLLLLIISNIEKKKRRESKERLTHLINSDLSGSYNDMKSSASSPMLHTKFLRFIRRLYVCTLLKSV